MCAAQRLIEMKAMNAERTKGERTRKERKRQEKEAAKLQEQCDPLFPWLKLTLGPVEGSCGLS